MDETTGKGSSFGGIVATLMVIVTLTGFLLIACNLYLAAYRAYERAEDPFAPTNQTTAISARL
jgi:hypothetical protein